MQPIVFYIRDYRQSDNTASCFVFTCFHEPKFEMALEMLSDGGHVELATCLFD